MIQENWESNSSKPQACDGFLLNFILTTFLAHSFFSYFLTTFLCNSFFLTTFWQKYIFSSFEAKNWWYRVKKIPATRVLFFSYIVRKLSASF